MTINMQYLHMSESDSLSKIVTRNLKKLEHKYQFIIGAEVFFKIGNSSNQNDKICEIELSAPRSPIFAKSTENNFEKAAAETVGNLERQLRKRKEKFGRHI